jgi:hypothetical protein
VTPGLLAATIWLSLGVIGVVAEGWFVLEGRHDRGDLIRHAVREHPWVMLAFALGMVLTGPIQLGLLLGSYRPGQKVPPPPPPPVVYSGKLPMTTPCDRCGNRHEVLALLPLPDGREEKVCGDCLTGDPDPET